MLLHGGGNDWHEWSENLAPLSQVCEVFALDFPGFGLSERPRQPVHPSWVLSFLSDFLDALGLGKTALMGQSLGGMIAAAYALRHPERVICAMHGIKFPVFLAYASTEFTAKFWFNSCDFSKNHFA